MMTKIYIRCFEENYEIKDEVICEGEPRVFSKGVIVEVAINTSVLDISSLSLVNKLVTGSDIKKKLCM